MINQLTFLIFFFTVLQFHAQDNDIEITGRIINDSLSVENIHIINKNSNKATISNQYGAFKIPVKVDDTLVFSGIQFYTKEIHVTKKIVRNKTITIKLFQKINELDEVEIKTHNLSGSLVTDANQVKDTVSKIAPLALDFSMIDFSKSVTNDIDKIDRRKPPDISGLVNPHLQKGIGGASFTIDSPKKKRVPTIPEKIRTEFGNAFFIKTLKIPLEQIDFFIDYCKSKGIIDLYIKDRKVEVIDILIKESTIYRNLEKQD